MKALFVDKVTVKIKKDKKYLQWTTTDLKLPQIEKWRDAGYPDGRGPEE